MVKKLPANAEDTGDAGSSPGSGRSPTEGHGNPFQCSCLENATDRGTWWATVHGGHKESDTTEHAHTHEAEGRGQLRAEMSRQTERRSHLGDRWPAPAWSRQELSQVDVRHGRADLCVRVSMCGSVIFVHIYLSHRPRHTDVRPTGWGLTIHHWAQRPGH